MRLSEKQRNEPPVKLTRAEKREIQAIIRKYKGDGKAHSAQASIPYQAMYPDGICKVTANTFSKCIEFADISYQLAQADTKTAIFENLCDLYNYLDASIHVQLSFVNRKTDPKQYAKSFEIKAQGDDFDDIRAEYSRPACTGQQRPHQAQVPDIHHRGRQPENGPRPSDPH